MTDPEINVRVEALELLKDWSTGMAKAVDLVLTDDEVTRLDQASAYSAPSVR